jgi:hypothetical protein
MNIHTVTTTRWLSRNILLAALLATAVFQAEARPVLELLFPPEVSGREQPTDTRLWRYVPIGPRGMYLPVEGSATRSSVPPREVERWVGPRGTIPVYRND